MTNKNVLFCDANHGGLVLLEEYCKYTSNNLFFYDIYNKLSDEERNEISAKFNVTFLSLDEILSDEDSFIKIAPVHMPPVIKTDFTHHEFVAYLLKKMNINTKIIQVTGVKGKTTVATLLRSLLKDYNTLVLTSEKLTYNNKTLIEKLSITPASIITSINRVKEKDLLDDIDYCVFEVSLGVIPNAQLNVLTNILEDYPICRKSSSASVAKESVFSSEYTICDYDSYMKYYTRYDDVITLSLTDENADIYATDISYNIKESTFCMNYFDKKYRITHFALSDFFVNNLLFCISVGLLLGMDVDRILSNISDLTNIDGRNSYHFIKDKLIIEDINPGLNTTSIKKCVDNLEKFHEDYALIIGGDYGITCEEIDEEKLIEYIKTLDLENIIFTGKLGCNIKNNLEKKYPYFEELNTAIDFCIDNSDKKILQIIYRSEYDSNIYNLLKYGNLKSQK